MPSETYNQDREAPLTRRQKVVIGHPFLGRGGSEARVMWLIEALKPEFDVTVMTTGGWDLPALNSYYGTQVGQDEVTVRIAPVPFSVRSLNAAALRGACFQRLARQIASEYDIRISAYNPTDWGMPAIHFIADFSWNLEIREQFHPPSPGLIYRNTKVRRIYLNIAEAYGRPSGRDVLRDDLVIANSRWSAEIVKQYCGVDCGAVVYPPVSAEFPNVSWEKKEQSFALISRIAPEKRIERAIEILERVRQRGHSVQLHLCGQIENDPYGRMIAKLCRQHSDWIIQEGRVTGARKAQILSNCRFGIQTSGAEGFGISVAEMVKAGAIVFASDGGGQTEVIDSPDLLFSGVDDAADKICAVLSNPEKQHALRAQLALRSEMFSAGRFMLAAQAQVKKASSDLQSAQRLVHRRKVVIGHPRIGYGGSESTMMWLIEALKREFDVTVMTTGGWDLPALNSYYGTHVRQDEVKVRIAPVPFLARSLPAAALRGACFQSFARQIAKEYDIRISAYNPTDWGLLAIHFIADFSWNPEIRGQFHPPPPGFIYRESLLRSAYLKIAAAYGKPSGQDVLRDDVLIANSKWTAALIQRQCGVECAEVVYPPVGNEFSSVPWEVKKQSFAMISRIAPEKRIERAIEILKVIRNRGHAIQLHLCGQIENDPYGRMIAKLCRQHSDWIIQEGRVTGARKAQILSNCRFGIQTSGAEGFGISVAEMVKAGAIVFASDGGGQTEVIDNPDLLFSGVDDAADKICAVLSNPEKQHALRAQLALRSEMFSAGRFMLAAQAQVKKASSDLQSAQRLVHRRKVVIGHPRIGYGGSESTMMWLIEALKREFDVTVMTTGGWDLPALNSYYGTHVRQDEVKVRIAPVPFLARSLPAAALRGACFQSFARQIAKEYDIRISAYNPTDWGLLAIHFIADFSWNPEIRKQFDPPSPGFIYRESMFRWFYLTIAAAYGRPSGQDVLRDDVLIANSKWTAALIQRQCGVECAEVVYPPVGNEFSSVPWEVKKQSFVMIGRIAPEKRIERAIEILERVRQRGHSVQLHLCGQIESDLYGRQIAHLCQERGDWVQLEGRVTGARKAQILSNCRFGIQTRGAEPFGISVAEMVKAGAIVFAPKEGGQAEILGHPDLLFSSSEDAVEKILSVLENQSLQSSLRSHLRNRSEQFTVQDFMREVRDLATSFPTHCCKVGVLL